MNTRLLELAKKAGLHHRYDEYQDISYVTNEELFEQERHVNDKRLIEILTPFTELIIRECCDIIQGYESPHHYVDGMIDAIKNHFGVDDE